MKRSTRILSFILSMMFLLMIVVACQPTDTTPTATTTAGGTTTTATTTADTSPRSLQDYDDVMRITGLITAYMGGPARNEDTEFYKRMLEEFKIELDVSWDVNEGVTKAALFVAGGDMPDFLVLAGSALDHREVAEQLYKSNQLMDIENYIDNTVELKRYLSADVLDANRNEDGTLTRLPNFSINPDLIDELTVEVLTVLTVRKDLREQVGFQNFPATPNEFYEMLKAFKDLPQVDGRNFIPFCTLWNGDTFQSHIGAMFGIHSHKLQIVEAENRMYSIYEGDDYLEYLKYAAKLYREGLVYPDAYTTSWEELYFDFAPNGQVGSFAMWSPDIDHLSISVSNVVSGASYEVLPLPKVAGLASSGIGHNNTLGATVTLSNKNISDPERYWLLLDWLTTREGLNWVNNGPPSKDNGTWFIDTDGSFVQNKEVADAKTAENASWAIDTLGSWSYGLTGVIKYTPDLQFDKYATLNRGRTEAAERYTDELYLNPEFDLYQIATRGEIAKTKSGDVDKVFNEGESKIIMFAQNDAEVEAQYAAMIAEARAAGWMDVLADDYAQKYVPIFGG